MINNKSFLKTRSIFVFATTMFAVIMMTVVAPFTTKAETFPRELDFGMRGDDVSALQTFLALDNTIYPEALVTGYFGSLTKAAIIRFQIRNNIAGVGRIGPITLALIRARIANGEIGVGNSGGMGAAALIVNVTSNVTNNSATINWSTNESARGVVYYSPTPLTLVGHSNSVDVSGFIMKLDDNLRMTQSVLISGLQANTLYHYVIYVTDMDGNVSITMPATFQTTN